MKNSGTLKSFKFAFRGIRMVFNEERNFKLQLLITLVVLILMFMFKLSTTERSILILLIILTLVLEFFNSIIERLSDLYKPRLHVYIRDIKDIAAGTVLITAIGSAIVGIIIFFPHIKEALLNYF